MIENISFKTLVILTSNANAFIRGYSERLGTPKICRKAGDSSRLNFYIAFNSLLKNLPNVAYDIHEHQLQYDI